MGVSAADPPPAITSPYLQNPTQTSVEVYWVDSDRTPVKVSWLDSETTSHAVAAPELWFQLEECLEFPELKNSPPRFLHRALIDNLSPGQQVEYTVHFPGHAFTESFRSLPNRNEKVRLIAYADSETEPESTGKPAQWGHPQDPRRKYLVDQTTGYRQNLKVIRERNPNAVLIAGDLVESGGEQRDWDEFWNQASAVAGSIPILPAPGNHEYWGGPRHGRYSESGSRFAIGKYRTYFHPTGEQKARHFYRKDIGPATLISLDSGDGLEHGSSSDSNHYLEAAGDFGADYNPGSEQWRWLEQQLQSTQKEGRFTIVMFHHCPYSSGPHGFQPGQGEGKDPQSGQPLRVITPLLHKYGVDLVLSGHDEMFERSEVRGFETLSDGSQRPHTLQVYDVGVGGDGLRGPERSNSYGKFLAYQNSPEKWTDGILTEGGRHYGHLEIDVESGPKGWRATLTPVYILPKKKRTEWSFERREYPDPIVLEEGR